MPAVIAPTIWRYTRGSLDRLVALSLDLTEAERAERPPIEEANSIATLVGHTLANAEDNLLGTLAGLPVTYHRQADFDAPETDATAIRDRWDALQARIEAAIATIDDVRVLGPVSHPRRGEVTGLEVLLVVARHAAEHLAHAELTRDWLRSR